MKCKKRLKKYRQTKYRITRGSRTEYRRLKKIELKRLRMIKITKWQVVIFFSIVIAFALGITLLNDESSKETVKTMFYWTLGLVVFFFLVSYIRYKIGSE